MLIKNVVLERIAAGEVDTLFRRQKRPTVKTGGTLRTRIGMLDIVRVDRIGLDEITPRDARRGGFGSVDEVVAELTQKPDGEFYRVRIGVGGIDPWVALREQMHLSAAEIAAVRKRLGLLDARSVRGAWTQDILSMIAAQPHVRAPDLAASIGWETKAFKENVRKLKGLGLTISHNPGYELSPRGRVVLDAL
ncbi:MAG: hypothetical protein ABIP17_05480 [Ilumatobacteraceae bacterium]